MQVSWWMMDGGYVRSRYFRRDNLTGGWEEASTQEGRFWHLFIRMGSCKKDCDGGWWIGRLTVTIVNGCPSLVDDDGRKRRSIELKHKSCSFLGLNPKIFRSLAITLCNCGSWSTSFQLRTLLRVRICRHDRSGEIDNESRLLYVRLLHSQWLGSEFNAASWSLWILSIEPSDEILCMDKLGCIPCPTLCEVPVTHEIRDAVRNVRHFTPSNGHLFRIFIFLSSQDS